MEKLKAIRGRERMDARGTRSADRVQPRLDSETGILGDWQIGAGAWTRGHALWLEALGCAIVIVRVKTAEEHMPAPESDQLELFCPRMKTNPKREEEAWRQSERRHESLSEAA